jgi:L-aminopeptidase/D-esterase-like protein
MNDTITRIPGLRVGHATDREGVTGVTVLLCERGAVGGVDQRGGAPGTRETDLLRPMHLVREVHAVVLAGGSAFGLAAADGVMHYLAERGVGYPVPGRPVPIVPAAILFDLGVGRADAYPDASAGYAACLAAAGDPVVQGGVGAGTGCTVGKLRGMAHVSRGGIGSACFDLGGGLLVGALIAVNAFGDVIGDAGEILAGTRDDAGGWADSLALLRRAAVGAGPVASSDATSSWGGATGAVAGEDATAAWGGATVIGVMATNARLDKEQVNKVAQMAQDGLARAVRPAHTMYDGDTLFALATGEVEAEVTAVGAYAAEAVSAAIRRAVLRARESDGRF